MLAVCLPLEGCHQYLPGPDLACHIHLHSLLFWWLWVVGCRASVRGSRGVCDGGDG